MTSKQVKNQVRDGFENGIDQIHKFADLVTFPLAPLDGAIHGIARGGFNWLLDKHPKDKTKSAPAPPNNTGGYGCPPGGGGYGCPPGGGGYGPQPGGGGYGPQPGGGGYGSYPLGVDPNRKAFHIKGNEIGNNEGDTVGISDFGNGHHGSGGYNGQNPNDNAYYGVESNQIKNNRGKTVGVTGFGNY